MQIHGDAFPGTGNEDDGSRGVGRRLSISKAILDLSSSSGNFESMSRRPLVVDLDGTLFLGDSAWENLRILLLKKPRRIPQAIFYFLRGRASLKCWLYNEVGAERELPALRPEVVRVVQEGKAEGRPVHLVSGAPHLLVIRAARRLGLKAKDKHWGSTPGRNVTTTKADFLNEQFGRGKYDYWGDRQVDLPIFACADRGAVVGARPDLVQRALAANPRLQVLAPHPPLGFSVWKGLRPHQWVKNLLLLVPLLSAHAWDQPHQWLWAFAGMAAFSFLSSAVYLLNDLHDLEVDRIHPLKKTRPLASGELQIPEGLTMAGLLLVAAFGVAWFLGQNFFFCAATYWGMALFYNGWAKSQAGLDLIVLAAFYTLRILAGGAATEIVCSPWLLGYAIFLFLSLACVKRVSELQRLQGEKKRHAGGRGYAVEDLGAMTAIGIASGVVSVLVAALYVNSADVRNLYVRPQVLWLLSPVLFYWIIRIWLKTLRAQMPEDPVLFALKDRASWLLLALALVIGALASH